MNFYLFLSYEFREWLDVFSASDGVKIIFIGICGGRLLFIWKHENFAVGAHVLVNTQNVVISICFFNTTYNTLFFLLFFLVFKFKLLFCRGRLGNVPRFIIYVQSHCSAH